MENATCRTRVYLLATRNPLLNWQQYVYSRLAKVFLWSQFSGWVQKFCKELHNYSESSPSSSTVSTNCSVNYFDCLWCECFSCIPFWSFLHFFDRSLSLENDFWSFTFCRLFPRWDRVSCMKNHELLFCWHSNYTWGLSYIIGLFSETAFTLSFAGGWFALHSWTSILVLSLALPIVIASPLAKVLPFSRNRSFGCSTDSP